ncbi:MAG: M20/M25/M40 family metallo-hydrolase [Salinibacterium sp.]|nr:M20/M25/M40 family metallo-hydrolase [Salinibacterium sp.]
MSNTSPFTPADSLAALDHAIAARATEALSLLARLVEAPSVVGREQAALLIFESACGGLGLQTRRLPFSSGPVDDRRAGVAPDTSLVTPNRFQVLATTAGSSDHLTLLLNGHMDVVPAETPDMWTTAPFTAAQRDGRLYGRGAGDMKAGFAVGYLALAGVLDTSPQFFDDRSLGFLAVIEEECTGNGTLSSIVDHGVIADQVIVLEPSDGGIMIGGVGVLWMDVDVVARSSHAFSAHQSPNAIDLALRVVRGLEQWAHHLLETDPDSSLTEADSPYNVNVGRLTAGDWTSTSPSTARLSVRCGYPRSWSADRAEGEVRAVIARITIGDADFPQAPLVRPSGLRAEGYALGSDHPLVRGLAAAHLDALGSAANAFSLGSTTDARIYVNDFATPAVCYGATAHDMHGIDESVDLASITSAARALARFILTRFAADASRDSIAADVGAAC